MELLVKFIMFHYGLIIIAEKYNVRSRLKNLAKKIGAKKWGRVLGRFLYEVSECQFCVAHHIGIVPMLFLVLVFGFKLEYLIFPFMSTAFLILITGNNGNNKD